MVSLVARNFSSFIFQRLLKNIINFRKNQLKFSFSRNYHPESVALFSQLPGFINFIAKSQSQEKM
jgi:hypothetical protein